MDHRQCGRHQSQYSTATREDLGETALFISRSGLGVLSANGSNSNSMQQQQQQREVLICIVRWAQSQVGHRGCGVDLNPVLCQQQRKEWENEKNEENQV